MYVCVFLSFINSAENQLQTVCQALGQTWWDSSWFSWDPQWSLVFVSFLILKRLISQSIWAQIGTFPHYSHCLSPSFTQARSLPWSSGSTQSLTPCSHKVPETNMDTHCGYVQLPHCRKVGQKQEKEYADSPRQHTSQDVVLPAATGPIYSREMQYITLMGSLTLGIFFSTNHFEHFRKNCSRFTDFLLRQKVRKRFCLLKNWRKAFKIA